MSQNTLDICRTLFSVADDTYGDDAIVMAASKVLRARGIYTDVKQSVGISGANMRMVTMLQFEDTLIGARGELDWKEATTNRIKQIEARGLGGEMTTPASTLQDFASLAEQVNELVPLMEAAAQHMFLDASTIPAPRTSKLGPRL